MNDDDTKNLMSIYDGVAGVPDYEPMILTESMVDIMEYLTEDMINSLGQTLAAKLAGLITRDMKTLEPNVLEKKAQALINVIQTRVNNPMIQRTLRDYQGLPALSKAKVIYQLLSNS